MADQLGDPVLDVGTGTGRIAWRLADAGCEVVGVDLSPSMLERAEAKRANHAASSARVTFLCQDMTALALDRRFPLVLVPYRSFNHLLTPDAQIAALGALRRHLAPDGRAVIHLFDPPVDLFSSAEDFERHRHLNIVHPRTKEMLRWRIEERQVDASAQRIRQVVSYRIERPDGTPVRETREVIEQRWILQDEMRELLGRTGFAVVALHGDFFGGPPARGREQVWVLRGN